MGAPIIETPLLPYELGILHLLQVANQSGLSSCPLPSADAGPVSSYTYMIHGLGGVLVRHYGKQELMVGHSARWWWEGL